MMTDIQKATIAKQYMQLLSSIAKKMSRMSQSKGTIKLSILNELYEHYKLLRQGLTDLGIKVSNPDIGCTKEVLQANGYLKSNTK